MECWYFDENDKTVSTIIDGDNLEVCCVSTFDSVDGRRYHFGEKSLKNAALLTAAPALLEALELALAELIEKSQKSEDEFYGGEKITIESLHNGDKYLAAIAAAKGE